LNININKIANTILLMLDNKVSHLNDKKLLILLFLIDYNHLKNCNSKIFDETYIKTNRNPQAKTMGDIFEVIANNEDIDEEDERLYIIQELLDFLDIEIFQKENFIELKFVKMEEEFDKSIFSKDELKTIDKVISLYKKHTPRKIANVCFGIDEVRQTKIGEIII